MNGTGEGKQKDGRPVKDDEAIVKAPPLTHITQGYHSLALLVRRLKQDTFNRLAELIEDIQDGTEKDRKLKIINFMMERRQQWTKILVLVMYAKKAQDLPGLIDLSNYFWQFKESTNRFLGEMLRIRYDFVTAKCVGITRLYRKQLTVTEYRMLTSRLPSKFCLKDRHLHPKQ